MKFPPAAQQKREFGSILWYAAQVFLPCSLLGCATLVWLRALGYFLPLSPHAHALLIVVGTVLVSSALYVAAFAWVAVQIGGSRKERTKAVRRVAVRVWHMEIIKHLGILFILYKRPEWLVPTEAAAQSMITQTLLNAFGVYLFIIAAAALGRRLSFRFARAPEEDWGQYRR